MIWHIYYSSILLFLRTFSNCLFHYQLNSNLLCKFIEDRCLTKIIFCLDYFWSIIEVYSCHSQLIQKLLLLFQLHLKLFWQPIFRVIFLYFLFVYFGLFFNYSYLSIYFLFKLDECLKNVDQILCKKVEIMHNWIEKQGNYYHKTCLKNKQ